MQVKEVTDGEGFISDCVGAAGDEGLDLAPVPPKQLCFLAFLPNILDTKVPFTPHSLPNVPPAADGQLSGRTLELELDVPRDWRIQGTG